jgi:serine/threonine protein kinase
MPTGGHQRNLGDAIHSPGHQASKRDEADPARPFVLIDLGIAFGLLETGLTIQGVPRTNRYLAPEMSIPDFRSNLDYRTDLYTTALTVYEYAAGKHPIAEDSDDDMLTITRALHQAARPLQDARPDFSPEFCKLIDQLLKKKPSLRPANLDWLIAQTEI